MSAFPSLIPAPIVKNNENSPFSREPRRSTHGNTLVALRLVPKQLPLIDIGVLDKELDALSGQKQRAQSTLRSYQADLRSFEAFCQATESAACPALPLTICRYLMYEAEQGLTIATITGRLVSITWDHSCQGLPSPCNAQVGAVLAQLRRRIGTAEHPKNPIMPDDLKAMLAQLGDDTLGLRDKAVLLVGFGSGCRRSELAALNLADVAIKRDGLQIHIAKSKTDQEQHGRDLGIERGEHEETCPVRALEKWLAKRGEWSGPLFCRVGLHTGKITQHRLAPAAIAQVVKAAAKRAGMETSSLAAHSLRSGCATSSAANGADTVAIARRLGHASTKSTEKYIRIANIFLANPLKGIL